MNKYILVRDTVFFVVDFFTGDRASDLGRLLANQVFRLKDRKGFFLKLTLTKTTPGSAASPFILETFEDDGGCPVAWIEYYLSVRNITIEFMFLGINMFWARLRLILARAARRGLK